MCINTILKVKTVTESSARMEDGRTVHLGQLTGVKTSDYLEVYANLAFRKIAAHEAESIRMAQGFHGGAL